MGSVRAETERGSAGVHAVDPPPKANRDGSTRWKRLVTDRALVKCVLSEALRQGVCGAYQTASPLGQSRGPHGTRPTAFQTTRPRFGYLQIWVRVHREGWQLKARALALSVARPLGAPQSRTEQSEVAHCTKDGMLVATALSAPLR